MKFFTLTMAVRVCCSLLMTIGTCSLESSRAAEPILQKNGRRNDGLTTVIAHRGSSGERPEHTLAAYRRALEQGADLIEMDLQLSRDGVLVGLHDSTLDRVSDIADHAEFAERQHVDKNGKRFWQVRDFDLAELRTLRIRHFNKGQPTEFDRQETIPTFAEQIALVRAFNAQHQTRIGLCPELKGVSAHKAAGQDLVGAFVKSVNEHRLENDPSLPVVVQCFELEALEQLRPRLTLPMAFLSSSRPDDQQLDRIARTATIVAVNLKAIQPDDSADWIKRLHSRGLGVIAWTYRDDVAAMRTGVNLGLDGFFTDFPSAGITARSAS